MVCVATRANRSVDNKRAVTYRSYEKFNEVTFFDDLANVPFHVACLFDDMDDCFWAHNMLLNDVMNDNARIKKKPLRGKNAPTQGHTCQSNAQERIL